VQEGLCLVNAMHITGFIFHSPWMAETFSMKRPLCWMAGRSPAATIFR
jgi:hypothetical protein